MTPTRRTLLLLLTTPMLALSACGGSDEDDIKDIINEVSKDSSTICQNASKNLLKQLGGEKDCEELARAYPDETTTEIKGDIDVTVDGDTATAKFTDNENKPQTVKFVKEDGEWKADSTGTP